MHELEWIGSLNIHNTCISSGFSNNALTIMIPLTLSAGEIKEGGGGDRNMEGV